MFAEHFFLHTISIFLLRTMVRSRKTQAKTTKRKPQTRKASLSSQPASKNTALNRKVDPAVLAPEEETENDQKGSLFNKSTNDKMTTELIDAGNDADNTVPTSPGSQSTLSSNEGAGEMEEKKKKSAHTKKQIISKKTSKEGASKKHQTRTSRRHATKAINYAEAPSDDNGDHRVGTTRRKSNGNEVRDEKVDDDDASADRQNEPPNRGKGANKNSKRQKAKADKNKSRPHRKAGTTTKRDRETESDLEDDSSQTNTDNLDDIENQCDYANWRVASAMDY